MPGTVSTNQTAEVVFVFPINSPTTISQHSPQLRKQKVGNSHIMQGREAPIGVRAAGIMTRVSSSIAMMNVKLGYAGAEEGYQEGQKERI